MLDLSCDRVHKSVSLCAANGRMAIPVSAVAESDKLPRVRLEGALEAGRHC